VGRGSGQADFFHPLDGFHFVYQPPFPVDAETCVARVVSSAGSSGSAGRILHSAENVNPGANHVLT